ncbi:MAG TPA: cytochrome P450 [Nannocystaceae bacterium]|nr:cytochrome P450 [Nannocystaceae bacterium]
MSARTEATSPRTLHLPVLGGGWPVVGHTFRLFKELPKTFRELQEGPGPLCWMKIFGLGWVLVYTRRESFDLFMNRITTSARMADQAEVVIGRTSMVAADGAAHRHLRKAASGPFTPRGLTMSGVSATMAEVIEARVEGMLRKDELVLLEETQRVALDIIFRIMGIPEAQLEAWGEKYTELLKGVVGPHVDVPPFPHFYATRARRWLDERLRAYIQSARSNPEAQGLVAEMVRGRDDEGHGLSDEELLDNLRLLVLAGHETTASVMAWMASYMALDPKVHDRVVAEATTTEGLPQAPAEMGRHPYAEALFRESLRLHPPVAMQNRQLTAPLEVDGVTVPEGTTVAVPIWLLSRDPELYPDPDAFDPERWIGRDHKLGPLETAQFGGGPHFCLGYHMAWVEAVMFVTCLARGLARHGKRLSMAKLPGETAFPLTRPDRGETRARLVPAGVKRT